MQVLRVLDSSGDSVLEFDAADSTASATQAARELFERLTSGHYAAFDGAGGGKIASFNQVGDETLLVPKLVGG